MLQNKTKKTKTNKQKKNKAKNKKQKQKQKTKTKQKQKQSKNKQKTNKNKTKTKTKTKTHKKPKKKKTKKKKKKTLLSTHFHTLLSKLHDIATLCHLYKIVHFVFVAESIQPHPPPTLRNLNSFALDPLFCRLTLSQRSFYPYAPTLWN